MGGGSAVAKRHEKLCMTAHLFPSRPAQETCPEALTFCLSLGPRLLGFIYSEDRPALPKSCHSGGADSRVAPCMLAG